MESTDETLITDTPNLTDLPSAEGSDDGVAGDIQPVTEDAETEGSLDTPKAEASADAPAELEAPPVEAAAEPAAAGETEVAEAPIAGAETARAFAAAPGHVQFPEETLPIDTEIVRTPTGFLFKVPGRAAVNGHGRSIAAAMVDAQII